MKNSACVIDIVLKKESRRVHVMSNFDTFVDKAVVVCYTFVKREFIEQPGSMY